MPLAALAFVLASIAVGPILEHVPGPAPAPAPATAPAPTPAAAAPPASPAGTTNPEAAAASPAPAAPGTGTAVDWNFAAHIAPEDRALVDRYAATAKAADEAAFDLARRFVPAALQIQVRDDMARIRWRPADDRDSPWREALVCPGDRPLLVRLDGAHSALGPARAWQPLVTRGDRVIAPAAWDGRALLVRPGGEVIRLLVD